MISLLIQGWYFVQRIRPVDCATTVIEDAAVTPCLAYL